MNMNIEEMYEKMLEIAKEASMDVIVLDLAKAIMIWMEDRSKKNIEIMAMMCAMVMTKVNLEHYSADKMKQEFEFISGLANHFNQS